VLEENAALEPTTRRVAGSCAGATVTTYALKPVALRVAAKGGNGHGPGPGAGGAREAAREAALAAERARHIWYLPGGGKTPGLLKKSDTTDSHRHRAQARKRNKGRGPTVVFATPSAGADAAPRKWEALAWACRGGKKTRPVLHGLEAWDGGDAADGRRGGKRDGSRGRSSNPAGNPAGKASRHLDIDLGAERAVVAFSTQGAPPPTRSYPAVCAHRRSVEDDLFPYTRAAQHRHPTWTVVDACQESLAPRQKLLRWVKKYELFWRGDSGRAWHSLGVLAGNTETTSEKTHDLAKVLPGLVCRYLRVVPLEAENGGALRVQVFGNPGGGASGADAAAAAATRVDRTGGGPADEDLVEYTLVRPARALGGAKVFEHDVLASGSRDHWLWSDYATTRAAGKRRTKAELKKNWRGPC